MNAAAIKFWQKHRGLVWSNPNADDSVHIRAALLRPRFSLLQDIVVEFGLERVRNEWLELQRDEIRELPRAQNAFREAGISAQCDIGLARLCSGVPQRDDEGFAHLISKRLRS